MFFVVFAFVKLLFGSFFSLFGVNVGGILFRKYDDFIYVFSHVLLGTTFIYDELHINRSKKSLLVRKISD